MGRLISEQAVIESIEFFQMNPQHFDFVNLIDDIKDIPSAEPRWIPVSERLPKPNRLVLCYITTGATETYFLVLWNDTLNAWEEGIGGYRLLENDLGYKVVAWMPLPEPYKTESEAKE